MSMEIVNGEPEFTAHVDGEERTWTWWNTMIFTHRPAYQEYDHIFVESDQAEQETGRMIGTYIFRQTMENFDDLVELLDDYCFPHLIKPAPAEGDVEVWTRSNLADLDNADAIAAEWFEESHGTEA